jgi:hypothetical protein
MFIETVPNRTSPPAVLLRESYRDEQCGAQKRTLAKLSKLPSDIVEGLKALLTCSRVHDCPRSRLSHCGPVPLHDLGGSTVLASTRHHPHEVFGTQERPYDDNDPTMMMMMSTAQAHGCSCHVRASLIR